MGTADLLLVKMQFGCLLDTDAIVVVFAVPACSQAACLVAWGQRCNVHVSVCVCACMSTRYNHACKCSWAPKQPE